MQAGMRGRNAKVMALLLVALGALSMGVSDGRCRAEHGRRAMAV